MIISSFLVTQFVIGKVLCHLALIISHAGRNLPYVSYVIFKLGILELQGVPCNSMTNVGFET